MGSDGEPRLASIHPDVLAIMICPQPGCGARLRLENAAPEIPDASATDAASAAPAGTAHATGAADAADATDSPAASGPPSAGWLVCGACGCRYRVEERWPVMIPEEAENRPTDGAAQQV